MALFTQVMDEFEFIAQHLVQLSGDEALGLQDDVAIWSPPKGMDAVISMDTLVEGVHYPKGKFDAELAQKLLAVNVSDLTAKGADVQGYFLSLALASSIDRSTLGDFCIGLGVVQNMYSLALWGGDTTKSEENTVLTITIVGTVPKGEAVKRSGAQSGDALCVTGTIGDAFLGLKAHLKQLDNDMSASSLNHLNDAYNLPQPPYMFRQGIRKFATAALDVSDGLIADAGHLAHASNVGLEIDFSEIPLSEVSRNWLSEQSDEIEAVIQLATGGDDYQSLMSIAAANLDNARKIANAKGIKLTEIGRVVEGVGVTCLDREGNSISIEKPGFTHF